VRPDTTTGVEEFIIVPFPRLPLFEPQHLAVPSDSSAHVCLSPAAIALTPDKPDTTTAVDRDDAIQPAPN
jgi:hypothetical protein